MKDHGFLRSGAFHVWVMKDHCDEKVWSRVLSIDMDFYGRQLTGPPRPVKYFNDGSLLMFHCYKKALICADSRKSAVRYLKVCETKSPFVRAIAYIPSFVSLKHALPNQKENVKVLIDTWGFTELERETRDVYVVEEDLCNLYSEWDSDSDFDHFPLEASDSDSDESGHELYQEEIESEDEDQEIDSEDDEVDSEDEDREVVSEDGDHEVSS